MKISKLIVTPVATHDQPLLNSTGVQESYSERTIVQIETFDGYTGVGETHGGKPLKPRRIVIGSSGTTHAR